MSNNIVHFPNDFNEFDAMSLTQRMLMIEQLNEDMQTELDRITDAAAKIKDLMETNRKRMLDQN
ncbi:hypothetical protein [Sinorhizobium psoraleae]|uniref:Uncharacterized protein n=1 Tax=Sinorhizobium psoraleae TaxID=520838 RepID=A0ABT4KAS2_9HYPH|nr:hypothetical protein [Sinorhizobium psoraleae]MCZ4089061.1 hypothetical protein [Sinorhizobium psoraleae]